MWAIWKKSKVWRTRPADLVGLDDPYVGWCFDDAVYAWGSHVDSEIEKAVAENNKKKHGRRKDENQVRQAKLSELLDLPMEVRYRSFREAAGKAPIVKEKE